MPEPCHITSAVKQNDMGGRKWNIATKERSMKDQEINMA